MSNDSNEHDDQDAIDLEDSIDSGDLTVDYTEGNDDTEDSEGSEDSGSEDSEAETETGNSWSPGSIDRDWELTAPVDERMEACIEDPIESNEQPLIDPDEETDDSSPELTGDKRADLSIGEWTPIDEDELNAPLQGLAVVYVDSDDEPQLSQSAEDEAAGDIDAISVQGRVLSFVTSGMNDPLSKPSATLTIADEYAATTVTLSDQAAAQSAVENGVTPGDHVVIDAVTTTDSAEVAGESVLESSPASCVHVIDSVDPDETSSESWLTISSKLDCLWMYSDAETAKKSRAGIARIIVDEMHLAAPYGDDTVWMYEDSGEDYGLWKPFGAEKVDAMLSTQLPDDLNSSNDRREIVELVRSLSRVDQDEFNEGAPGDEELQWVVGFENCVVDLRTGEMHDHGPEWRLSSKIPVEYKPDEYDGSLGDGLDWFLDDVCKTDEDRRMCLSMAAHTLLRNHQIKSAFPIFGPSNSGKSKWHGVVKRLIGDDNVHSMEFPAFAAGDGFETGRVVGVHAAFDDDASGKRIKDLNYFKKVTGSEAVSVNEKYEKLSDYVPYATISWLSNDPAVLGERNSGVRSRLYPIVMPHRHTADDDQHKDKLPASELEPRIYAEEELEALAVAAVERAQQMYDAGDIDSERTEKERWNLYNEWADSVKRFFGDCVIEDPEYVTPKPAVYRGYVNWCESEGVEAMGRSRFWKIARRSGPYFETDGVWSDSSTRGVEHVRLGPEGLRHAPDAVLSELDDASQTIDSPTPVREINKYRGPSFYTVEATLREGDPYEPGWIAEGDDASIRVQMDPQGERGIDTVADEFQAVPNVDDGDRVLLQRFERVSDEQNRTVLTFTPGYSGVKILDRHPGDDAQSRISGGDVTEELMTRREALLASTSQETVADGGLDPVATVKAVLRAAQSEGKWSYGSIVSGTPDDIGSQEVIETMQMVESDGGAVMENFLPGGMTREDAVELVNTDPEDEDEDADDGNDEDDDDPDDEQGDDDSDGDEREGGQDDEDGGEGGRDDDPDESDASDLSVSEADFDGVEIDGDGSGSESKQVVRSDDVKPADVKTAVEEVNGSDAAPIDDIVAAVGADRVSVVSVVETMLDAGVLHEPAEDQYRVVVR